MRKARPEDLIQRAVFAHLRQRCMPGVVAFHVANGGQRSKPEASILKGLGVLAGVPDVIVIKNGHVFALELKAPGGRVSKAQADTQLALRAAGALTSVAWGLDDALDTLENWGLLRGKARSSSEHIGSMAELVRKMEERAKNAKAEYRKGLPVQR